MRKQTITITLSGDPPRPSVSGPPSPSPQVAGIIARLTRVAAEECRAAFPFRSDSSVSHQLARPLNVLGLPTRTRRILERQGIATLLDLVRRTEEQVICFRGMGAAMTDAIRDKLATLNLTLGMVPEAT